MEILFKDENYIYYIKDTHLTRNSIKVSNLDLDNIPHLNNTKVLYHYRRIKDNTLYPVYYEYNKRFITKYEDYPLHTIFSLENTLIKDYTLINLKLLENEDIIQR